MLPSLSSHLKELYNPKAFFTHAAWLDQSFSIVQYSSLLPPGGVWAVSQSQWGIILSDLLLIVDLVSRYLPTI